jgi:hypothetical protein
VPPVVARVYFGSRNRTQGVGARRGSHGGSNVTESEVKGDIGYGGSQEKEKEKGEALSIDSGADKGSFIDDEGDMDREYHIQEIENILDVFSDSYMNKHLSFGIVEAVLGKLVPEMMERGAGELLGERLG